MISIQQMQYILSLAEEGSFSRASEVCYVTQPTLSMQIKKAEDVLGQALFDRSSQPIGLTAFGQDFVFIVRDILNEYKRIEELKLRVEGTYREVIRMGIIPTVAAYLIPDLYAKWMENAREFQLTVEELKTDELIQAMREGKIDVGILSGPYSDSHFRSTRLFQEEILAYFPSSNNQELHTDQLSEAHPWLLTPGNCLRSQVMHFCNLKSSTDDWDYQGGNMDLLMNMVDQHGGYTLIPEFFGKRKGQHFKRIKSSLGEVPAREIIGLTRNKSTKWKGIERLLRDVQLHYATPVEDQALFRLLQWS